MELTHQFTVPAPIDVAWAAFNDLERIAPCFPGASLTSYDGQAFEGLVKVKLGPISLQYTGTGHFVERDVEAHHAVIEARGRDKRGNGTAAAAVKTTLAAAGDDATEVTVVTDLQITGKPAQFGRGVMQDVSDKLLAQFAACLEVKLGGEEAPAEEAAAETATKEPAAQAAAQAAAAPGAESAEETPIAAEAAEAAEAAKVAARSVGATGGLTDKAAYRSRAAQAPEHAPVAALDLGATVLPVLLKRFAPYLIGGLLTVWLLRRIVRRRRRRG